MLNAPLEIEVPACLHPTVIESELTLLLIFLQQTMDFNVDIEETKDVNQYLVTHLQPIEKDIAPEVIENLPLDSAGSMPNWTLEKVHALPMSLKGLYQR